jgi:uncharacterized membrane protein YfcA
VSLGPELLLVAAGGLVAGIVNVTAGGGSLLTVPLLILLGLPATEANGTNRLALVVQNVPAVRTFRGGGVSEWGRGLRLAAVALPGTVAGAILGVRVDDRLFERVLGVALLVMLFFVLRRTRPSDRTPVDASPRLSTYLAFAGLGFYAGFLQAGIGFLIMFSLVALEGLDLVRTNAVKVTFVLLMQAVALAVFAIGGKVQPAAGLVLAAGNATGAWIAVRLSLSRGERFIRPVLAAAVVAFAAKMLLFP